MESKNSPPQPRRGGRDINKNIAKPPLWSGRGGAGQQNKRSWTNTTPSARHKVASQLFIDRASTPPRLRRGVFALPFNFHS